MTNFVDEFYRLREEILKSLLNQTLSICITEVSPTEIKVELDSNEPFEISLMELQSLANTFKTEDIKIVDFYVFEGYVGEGDTYSLHILISNIPDFVISEIMDRV